MRTGREVDKIPSRERRRTCLSIMALKLMFCLKQNAQKHSEEHRDFIN